MTFLGRRLLWWSSKQAPKPKQKQERESKRAAKGNNKSWEESRMARAAKKRMDNELKKISSSSSSVDDDNSSIHCCYGPVDKNDPFHLQAIIIGPSETPFHGGIFFLNIRVPHDYPFKPPKIKFLTKVFHPNVTSDGTIELDILKNQWTPALTIHKLLLSICSFLPDPNHEPDSCNPVCHLYSHHRSIYDRIAREWTYKYAML